MEKTTCTLKVVSGQKSGSLYILDGELISAETQDLANLEAAIAIISWDDAIIGIENTCNKSENEINQPLMQVLMEGLKLNDEQSSQVPDADQGATVPSDRPSIELQGQEEPPPPTGSDISEESDEFELHVAPKEKRGLPKVPIFMVIVLMATAAVYFTVLSPGTESLDQIYQNTLAQVDLTDDIGEQAQLLEAFINSAGEESEWTEAARRKITELKTMRENTDYREISSRADDLVASKEFMQAVDLYKEHLRRFPDSPHKGEIKAAISKLTALAEETDYAAVTAAGTGSIIDRIDAYGKYVKDHPQNEKAAEVHKQLNDMEGEFFAYTEKQIAKSAMLEEWTNCTKLVENYADIYPDGANTQTLRKYLPVFEKNQLEYADYKKIMKKVHAAGTDYAKAQKILTDHLKAFPGTHLSKKIQDQIANYKKMNQEIKLNDRIAKLDSRLLESKGRFVSNGNGTFTDKHTGLMWCTLDSKSLLDNCLKYESAATYIKALNTGGHRDWRLPSPRELKTLFKVKPYFPATPSTWLWTSKAQKKYVGEWLIDVTIVTGDNDPSPANMIKDSRYCGNVRAVRRP